jgi:hypothetical protein
VNPLDPIRDVEWLPLWAEAGVLAHSAAVKIARTESTGYVAIAEPTRDAGRATWRVAELETDARLLFCRVSHAGLLTDVGLVDGTIVRGGGSGRRAFGVTLDRVTPALHIDATSLRNFTPCAASPGS